MEQPYESADASRPQFSIRPVQAEDASALNDLRRQPTVVEFTTSLPSERPVVNQRFLESLGGDDHVLVAETEAGVIGIAGLHVQSGKRRHVGVLGVAVHDAFQRRGIGRALLEALLDLADNYLGLVRVELEVFAGNTGAIQLYEQLGFEHEGRKRRDIIRRGQYEDVLVMGRLH